MDIDAILWPQRRFVTLNFPTDRVFYIAVEAVLRRHFDFVLTYLYNTAHHDHFYVDKAGRVGFSTATSKTFFVQSLCRNVLDLPVEVDGQWRSETNDSLEHAQRILRVTSGLGERRARYARQSTRPRDHGVLTAVPTTGPPGPVRLDAKPGEPVTAHRTSRCAETVSGIRVAARSRPLAA